MPMRALHPCGRQGCPNLTAGRYCPADQKAADKDDRRRRGSAAERGYDRPWAAYSKRYRMAHPVCALCMEAPTEHVDHIIPVSGPEDPLFWDPKNHQPACLPCHSRKTVTTDRRGLQHPPVQLRHRQRP